AGGPRDVARRRVDRDACPAEGIRVDVHPAGRAGGGGRWVGRVERRRALRPPGGASCERSAGARCRGESDSRGSNGTYERQDRPDECGRRTHRFDVSAPSSTRLDTVGGGRQIATTRIRHVHRPETQPAFALIYNRWRIRFRAVMSTTILASPTDTSR